jgi:hypothetical protein
MVAEQDAAAGDHDAAIRALDDAEALLGPLPTDVGARREAWRQLTAASRTRSPA